MFLLLAQRGFNVLNSFFNGWVFCKKLETSVSISITVRFTIRLICHTVGQFIYNIAVQTKEKTLFQKRKYEESLESRNKQTILKVPMNSDTI